MLLPRPTLARIPFSKMGELHNHRSCSECLLTASVTNVSFPKEVVLFTVVESLILERRFGGGTLAVPETEDANPIFIQITDPDPIVVATLLTETATTFSAIFSLTSSTTFPSALNQTADSSRITLIFADPPREPTSLSLETSSTTSLASVTSTLGITVTQSHRYGSCDFPNWIAVF